MVVLLIMKSERVYELLDNLSVLTTEDLVDVISNETYHGY